MQTLLTIDDSLLEQAAKLANTQNQNQLIELALSEFIKQHQKLDANSKILGLYGLGGIREDYDYKVLRNEVGK